jgi:hypothetical protein
MKATQKLATYVNAVPRLLGLTTRDGPRFFPGITPAEVIGLKFVAALRLV